MMISSVTRKGFQPWGLRFFQQRRLASAVSVVCIKSASCFYISAKLKKIYFFKEYQYDASLVFH